MGSAWSAFAVPASEIDRLSGALTGHDLDEATLIIGQTLSPVAGAEPWVAFGIEHNDGRYINGAMDDDLEPQFFEAFTRLVSLHGGSGWDDCSLTQYVRGNVRMQRDSSYGFELYPFVKLVGFDVVRLSRWAGFGINPCEFGGTRYDMAEDIPVLNPSDFTAKDLPAELEISESFDVLEARMADGGAAAVAKLALAGMYRGDTSRASMYDVEDVYSDLEEGPLKEAIDALFDMAARF